MAIATSTAIAIAAGASAASSVAAAKMGANASRRAAETQARSGQDALRMQGNVFRQQQAMQSPYMAMGNNAAMTLGRLMGAPQGARYAAPPMDMGQGGGGMNLGAMFGGPQAMRRPMRPGSSGIGPASGGY